MSEKRIKVLIVDDDEGFLTSIRDSFDLKYKDKNIEIIRFAKDIGEKNFKTIGASFIKYMRENKDNFIADIIFCDYDLKHGYNAITVLDSLEDIKIKPPIVIMTANHSTLKTIALETVEKGARGYIIKSPDSNASAVDISDYFIQEMIITILRINGENDKARILNIIADISKDGGITNIESLAKSFNTALVSKYPYFISFVREYDSSELKLIDSTITDTNILECISSFKYNDAPDLFKVLYNKDGFYIENNFDLESINCCKNYQDLLKEFNLSKAIYFRLGTVEKPLGTISIFTTQVKKNFSKLQLKRFKLATDIIANKWKLINEKEINDKNIDFFNKIITKEKEKEVWIALCELIHTNYNQTGALNKTSIKVTATGGNILNRIYCEGVECEGKPFEPMINAKTVSSWVYRNNLSCLITIDDLISKDNLRLTQRFIDNLATKDKSIEFHVTNPDMLGELCIPLATKNEVFGIINLETKARHIYTKYLQEEIENLVQVATKRVSNIRQTKFIEKLTMTLSLADRDERQKESLELLKEFIGYSVFTLVMKKENIIEVIDFDINKSLLSDNMRQDKFEEELNNNTSAIGSFLHSSEKYKYIEEASKEDVYIENIDGFQSKSQFLARLYEKEEAIGIISFDFMIKFPLNGKKREILERFVSWFNRDINENKEYKVLNRHVRFITKRDSFDTIFNNISHLIGNKVKYINSSLGALRRCLNDKEKFEREYTKLIKYTKAVVSFPDRFISSAKHDFKTFSDVFTEIESDIDNQKNIKYEILDDIEIEVKNTGNVYVVCFHPFLNASEEESVKNIILSIYKNNGYLIIKISDDGEGFKNLDTLFVTNETTKSSGGGFGLSYIRDVVEFELDGKIDAYNDSGGVVEIKIPINKEGKV